MEMNLRYSNESTWCILSKLIWISKLHNIVATLTQIASPLKLLQIPFPFSEPLLVLLVLLLLIAMSFGSSSRLIARSDWTSGIQPTPQYWSSNHTFYILMYEIWKKHKSSSFNCYDVVFVCISNFKIERKTLRVWRNFRQWTRGKGRRGRDCPYFTIHYIRDCHMNTNCEYDYKLGPTYVAKNLHPKVSARWIWVGICVRLRVASGSKPSWNTDLV